MSFIDDLRDEISKRGNIGKPKPELNDVGEKPFNFITEEEKIDEKIMRKKILENILQYYSEDIEKYYYHQILELGFQIGKSWILSRPADSIEDNLSNAREIITREKGLRFNFNTFELVNYLGDLGVFDTTVPTKSYCDMNGEYETNSGKLNSTYSDGIFPNGPLRIIFTSDFAARYGNDVMDAKRNYSSFHGQSRRIHNGVKGFFILEQPLNELKKTDKWMFEIISGNLDNALQLAKKVLYEFNGKFTQPWIRIRKMLECFRDEISESLEENGGYYFVVHIPTQRFLSVLEECRIGDDNNFFTEEEAYVLEEREKIVTSLGKRIREHGRSASKQDVIQSLSHSILLGSCTQFDQLKLNQFLFHFSFDYDSHKKVEKT